MKKSDAQKFVNQIIAGDGPKLTRERDNKWEYPDIAKTASKHSFGWVVAIFDVNHIKFDPSYGKKMKSSDDVPGGFHTKAKVYMASGWNDQKKKFESWHQVGEKEGETLDWGSEWGEGHKWIFMNLSL